MNQQYVKNVVEAALLAAGRPLTLEELMSVFDERDGSIADEVKSALATLTEEYETRGLELLEVASGFRIQIRAAVAQPVARLWQERPAKYSRALLETLAHCCDPRFNAPANFRAIVVGKLELAREGLRITHEVFIGKAFALNESALRIHGNTERAHPRVMDDKTRAGQRVENLVRQHHSVHRLFGQMRQPHDALSQCLGELLHSFALARGKIGAHLQDRVTVRQHTKNRQLLHHRRGHDGGTRSKLKYPASRDGEHFSALPGEALPEQLRHFRRGDEITAHTELHGAGAVIPEAGRIQCKLHEGIEGQPAASGIDARANDLSERRRVLPLSLREQRKH